MRKGSQCQWEKRATKKKQIFKKHHFDCDCHCQ